MTNIEKRFASNGDDGRLIERQLFRGASVKRKSRRRPTENRVANLAPLLLAGTSQTTIPGLSPVASLSAM